MRQLCLKSISVFTTAAFLATSLIAGPQPLYAKEVSPVGLEDSFALKNVLDLVLPQDLGRVAETFRGSSPKTVLLIQDAHANYSAQVSIQNILEFLSLKYGIDHIALEGGVGEMDATLFRQFPDEALSQYLFDSYLRRGELSGSVSAAVLSERPMNFFGVEDAAVYEAQIEAFLQAVENRPALQEYLSSREEALSRVHFQQNELAL